MVLYFITRTSSLVSVKCFHITHYRLLVYSRFLKHAVCFVHVEQLRMKVNTENQ